MRHLFILNPAAGKRKDVEALTREIQDVMAERTDPWTLEITAAAGDAERIADRWCREGTEPLRIYALGGDGTLNEVANGAAGYDHVAVGCCPLGSGNDFIKTFGTDGDFRSLKALVEAPAYPVDLIDCNGRISVNICSIGIDARVGLGMSKYRRMPLVSGNGAYNLSLVENVIRGISRRFRIQIGNELLTGKYTLIAVCHGRWYGGTFNPVPDACPDDGELDLVIVKGCGRLTVAGLVGKYASGQGKNYPELIRMQRCNSVTITSPTPTLVQLDGERMETDSLSVSLSAKKLRFLVPESTGYRSSEP